MTDQAFHQVLRLACPGCSRGRRLAVRADVPRQRFDRKCCSAWIITVRPLRHTPELTVWEVEWEPAP